MSHTPPGSSRRQFLKAGTLATVGGTVRALGGRPVASARIAANDSTPGTSTDSLGRFTLSLAPALRTVLVVSADGFVTPSDRVTLGGRLTFDTLALRTMLRYLDPNVLEDPGSSLTSALDRAGRYFETNRITPRLMLLVSDGEDLTGNPVETARELGRKYLFLDQLLRCAEVLNVNPAWLAFSVGPMKDVM